MSAEGSILNLEWFLLLGSSPRGGVLEDLRTRQEPWGDVMGHHAGCAPRHHVGSITRSLPRLGLLVVLGFTPSACRSDDEPVTGASAAALSYTNSAPSDLQILSRSGGNGETYKTDTE